MQKNFLSRHTLRFLFYSLAAAIFILSSPAQAAGPVDAASLPGGAAVVDSDGGSGEQWGRAGGRTISYSGFVLGNFTMLEWQPSSAAMAFDGEITGATLEEMTGPSLIAPDTLQWTGETTITNDVTATNETVYTRFTVVADTFFSGPPPYAVDVMLAGGNFEINVLFEASLNPGGPYVPALDFFDAYPTPIGHDGFAMTSFNQGFWFEQLVGMTIEEHDSNMQGRFDDVDGAIEYLTIESVNRLMGIMAKVMDNNDKLIWAKSDLEDVLDALNQLINAGGGDWATEEDLSFLRDFLSQQHDDIRDRIGETEALMLCMWIGNDLIPVCPPQVPPGLPNLFALTSGQEQIMEKLEWAKADIETLSAQIAASHEIDISAVKSPKASGKSGQVFMVLTTVNGAPVDAVVTSVSAVTESSKNGIGVESPAFTTEAVMPGFQSLTVDLPGSLNSTKTVIITVEYTDGDNTLQGATLISDS